MCGGGIRECVKGKGEEGRVCVLPSTLPFPEPPYFTTSPVDTRVVTGSHFILSCEAVSYEGHTHTRWLVGTQEVGVVRAGVGRARREVLGDGSLLVTRAELSDAGEYTCSASNKYGVMNATAFVTVLSECDISRD